MLYTREMTQTDCSLPSRLRRGKTVLNECLGYITKQSNGEAPVMQELWGMRRALLLPTLPGLSWLGVVTPDRVLSLAQI